jgi:GNAT superfamily N-acetyltransferase
MMISLPLAFHPPDPTIAMRPVRLMDTDSLSTDCWPDRSFTAIYNLVGRITRSQADGRGLGLVVPGENDNVCGYGQLLLWPSCAEISDMVVIEPYRGRGYGTAIIQALVREAVKLGAEEAEIGASVDNPRAAALYRRLGFEDSHTVHVNVGGGKEHILYLRLNLRNVRLPVRRE